MNHTDYIGRPLKDLVSITPSYAINFYQIIFQGKVRFLEDIPLDDDWMDAKVKSISELYQDYHYDILLVGS